MRGRLNSSQGRGISLGKIHPQRLSSLLDWDQPGDLYYMTTPTATIWPCGEVPWRKPRGKAPETQLQRIEGVAGSWVCQERCMHGTPLVETLRGGVRPWPPGRACAPTIVVLAIGSFRVFQNYSSLIFKINTIQVTS